VVKEKDATQVAGTAPAGGPAASLAASPAAGARDSQQLRELWRQHMSKGNAKKDAAAPAAVANATPKKEAGQGALDTIDKMRSRLQRPPSAAGAGPAHAADANPKAAGAANPYTVERKEEGHAAGAADTPPSLQRKASVV